MYKLTLYKNHDPDQPLEFTGKSQDSCVYKLRQWMKANKGATSDGPFGVDGLTIFPHEYNDEEVVFVWCETYSEWRIEYGPDSPDADTWAQDHFDSARDEFLEAVKTFGDWEW